MTKVLSKNMEHENLPIAPPTRDSSTEVVTPSRPSTTHDARRLCFFRVYTTHDASSKGSRGLLDLKAGSGRCLCMAGLVLDRLGRPRLSSAQLGSAQHAPVRLGSTVLASQPPASSPASQKPTSQQPANQPATSQKPAMCEFSTRSEWALNDF